MSRSVNTIIVCEDRQHEAFARRFLALTGVDFRVQRVEISPSGRGSGEQFVRKQYVKELADYRARQHRVSQSLIVIIDSDLQDVTTRIEQIESAAVAGGQDQRQPNERVAIFVPARNIETWLAYLDGQTVNENDTYPRLRFQRDCQRHVEILNKMCQKDELREPAPSSLKAACKEFRDRLASVPS
jgi:hypothetical protein